MKQFFIVLVVVEGQNRDAVFQLEAERVDCVVDNDQVFEISVLDYPQILDMHALLSLHT